MKKIKDYKNYYITKDGRVYSKKPSGLKELAQREINGYKVVKLSKDGKTKNHKVHRLVAIAYIPNPENKPQVNHIDENKHNNKVNNLEWNTAKENNNHGTHNERVSQSLKTSEAAKVANGSRKIKVCQYIYIDDEKVIIKIWDSATDAMNDGSFNDSTIAKCCKGKRKTHKGFYWEYYKE